MKKKKGFIIAFVVVFILALASLGAIYFFKRPNHLTVDERKWIDTASSTSQVLNINVINNVPAIGYNAKGIFYDFLKDFEEKYALKLNIVAYNTSTTAGGVTLGAKTSLTDNDALFFTDHFVLISSENEILHNATDLEGKEINVLASDLDYVKNFVDTTKVNLKPQEDTEKLFEEMKETKYAMVPLHAYLSEILENNYNVIYHFSDINIYYTLSWVQGDNFSSVLRKYFETWKENITTRYNINLFNEIVDKMGITDTEIDKMRSTTYNYGYIDNSPYEASAAGNYGGITARYLKNFAEFADIEIDYKEYKNITKLNKAIGNNKIDFFFNYYDASSDFTPTTTGINVSYSIVANNKNNIVINSINSLIGKTVYVQKNTTLYNYLKGLNGINIQTYETNDDLKDLNKEDVIIFIDSNTFSYYRNHGLDNYSERYKDTINLTYTFKFAKTEGTYKLFNKYISLMDPNKELYNGLYEHEKVISSGTLIASLARYIFILLIILAIIFIIVIKKTRKISIAKKIKKEDKLKFIDQLTMLKNRNYLNENIDKWNNNTIYPQAILVMDLNRLQEINDIQGYEEGDRQIQAAANALIKTQLDNSDIIRTDGNEFVVYLVGYSQKQITNYIHKLNKEFKKLPYDYGAEFGYSIIVDDLKSIEDALNEATKALKEQKDANESKESE